MSSRRTTYAWRNGLGLSSLIFHPLPALARGIFDSRSVNISYSLSAFSDRHTTPIIIYTTKARRPGGQKKKSFYFYYIVLRGGPLVPKTKSYIAYITKKKETHILIHSHLPSYERSISHGASSFFVVSIDSKKPNRSWSTGNVGISSYDKSCWVWRSGS